MKKKLIIGLTIFLFIICIAVLGWDFYVDEGTMNNSLELAVPLFNKKELRFLHEEMNEYDIEYLIF